MYLNDSLLSLECKVVGHYISLFGLLSAILRFWLRPIVLFVLYQPLLKNKGRAPHKIELLVSVLLLVEQHILLVHVVFQIRKQQVLLLLLRQLHILLSRLYPLAMLCFSLGG